jgi:methionine aminopeptidase
VIIGKRDHSMKVDAATFETNEVYSVDICLSTGEGKPKQAEQRTTVFKRAVDKSYRLKMKASRYLFNEMNTKFPTLPFTLRAFEDEKTARMGVVECQKHDLVVPYPVLLEKEGSLVVHFKFTVLLLPSGTVRITEGAIDPTLYSTEVEVPAEVKEILAMSSKTNNKKKKNKNKKAGATEEASS